LNYIDDRYISRSRSFSLLFRSLLFLSLLTTAGARAAAADAPKVIRVAMPGVGIGNRPIVGGSSFGVLHARGLLEQEFGKDGIKVEFSLFKGAGPAVNEAVANGLADIWLHGDLPSIIGRAGGLRTKILLADAIRGTSYVAVPADSPITTLDQLRGKRVALFRGTNNQLAANRLLAGHGLRERDLRVITMDTAAGKAALITEDVDAMIGGSDLITLRNQGVARII
jgi:sulfonate transport system substrate-binding protein